MRLPAFAGVWLASTACQMAVCDLCISCHKENACSSTSAQVGELVQLKGVVDFNAAVVGVGQLALLQKLQDTPLYIAALAQQYSHPDHQHLTMLSSSCAAVACADRWCDCGGVCVHGPQGACTARRFLVATAVSSCAAAFLHLPVQLPGW